MEGDPRIYKEKRGGKLEAPSLGLFGPKRASKSALKTQRTLATFRLLGAFKREKRGGIRGVVIKPKRA